jgi:hypothetical protein
MEAQREAQIQRQIDNIKRKLAAIGELRPGSLSRQQNVCGTPGCHCKAEPPKKRGPFYQISFTRRGDSSTKFVRKEDVPAIDRQLKTTSR